MRSDSTDEGIAWVKLEALLLCHSLNQALTVGHACRLQLFLSKTITIHGISLSDVVIEELDDIPSTVCVFSCFFMRYDCNSIM